MRIRVLLAVLAVIAVGGFVAAPGFTEEEPPAPAAGAEHDQSAWEALQKRGPHHEWMSFMVGSWNASAKFWMGPDADPQTSSGQMESYWVSKRRFMRSNYSGEWEDKEFRGEATMGFNNATQKYETVWFDTMSTGMARAEGTREGDVITLKGKSTMPQMGEVPYTTTYKKLSADSYMMYEVWEIPGMGEMKVMEITYTRAQ